MKLKKIILIGLISLLGSTLLLSLDQSTEKTVRLTIYSFTDELERPIRYFQEKNPNVEIEFTIIRTEDYPDWLIPRLRSGEDAPDIFTGEAAFLKRFLDEGFYDNLEKSPYKVDASSLVPYTVDFGRDTKTGAISALSWQVCPGGFFYRRSIAKKVFGTDNPAVIGRKMNTMDKFLETGRKLKKKGYFLVPGLDDLSNMVIAQRTGPWIVNGEIQLEDSLIDYFDTAKTIYNEELEAQIGQWSPAWFDSMKRDGKVFAQLLPTWGLHYVMKPNAHDSSGDWAVCQPPGNFFWGGSWIGVYKGSKNKETAWAFVKMMCLDPDFGEWWANETGDVISNMSVVDKIKNSFSDDYLDGQNHYKYFGETAKEINGKYFSSLDSDINKLYFQEVELYAAGEKSKKQAISDFKKGVPSILEAAKKPKLSKKSKSSKRKLKPRKRLYKGGKKKTNFTGTTLSLWSFTDELERPIEYFEEMNPDIEINLTIVHWEDYPSKLKSVIRSGEDIPDIFTGEAAFLKQFLDRGYYDNLEKAPYNVNISTLVPYTVDLGRDTKTGAISALSWQVCPGGFFYRRSIAKEVFGTDNPAIIGKKVSTMANFVETGRALKKKGYYLIPGMGDLSNTVMALRSKPWVVDEKLILEDIMVDYFDVAKAIYNEGLDGRIDQWSPAWFDSMKMDSKVFAQLLPTWGLHYVMKPNAPDSSGDWAVCHPPGNFYWGGTWIGVYKDSKKKEAAWKFVKMMCLDPNFGEWWADETGDTISNMTVVDKIKSSFSDDYLNGQNHYKYFAEAAEKVDGLLFTSYDKNINAMFFYQVQLYISGEKSKGDAIADFKEEVYSAYPYLIVE